MLFHIFHFSSLLWHEWLASTFIGDIKLKRPKSHFQQLYKSFSRMQHCSMGLIICWIQPIGTVLYILTRNMSQITNFDQNRIIPILMKKRTKKFSPIWETHSTAMSLHLYSSVWRHSNCVQERLYNALDYLQSWKIWDVQYLKSL